MDWTILGAGLAGIRFSGINTADVPEKQLLHIAAGAAIGLSIAGIASSIVILKELKAIKEETDLILNRLRIVYLPIYQQSLKITSDEFVSDIMSFPWIGLLIVVACLTVGVIGSYLGLRWWYRSILKNLEHRQQQKSKQKK